MSKIKVNSLEGVGASTPAISIDNASGTCTANITNKPNRNLIINGAMQVAQRGTSSTSSGINSVDRFNCEFNGTDEAPTQAQADVASGTTPYTLGFRKAFKITNGNQTSGAGAADYINLQTKLEAQDIANSGWNYLSSSSSITLSFWIKSSVAQNFYGFLRTRDGTEQNYPFETGALTADTWTKITKTIVGNSNLTFNNDNGEGIQINISPFWGTNNTGSVSLNAWAAYSGSTRTPDYGSANDDWYTTNDATWEITGVQLEVGSVATDFEHRSFGQELALCERYCQIIMDGGDANDSNQHDILGVSYSADNVQVPTPTRTRMRAAPSMTATTGSFYWRCFFSGTSVYMDAVSLDRESPDTVSITFSSPSGGNISQGTTCFIRTNTGSSRIFLTAEL